MDPTAGEWPERRASRRVPLRSKVHMEFEEQRCFLSEFTLDISLGGMFVASESPLAVGRRLLFECRLTPRGPVVSGAGEVAWVRSEGDGGEAPAGMAVRFVALDEHSADLLLALVQADEAGGAEAVRRLLASAADAWQRAQLEEDATGPLLLENEDEDETSEAPEAPESVAPTQEIPALDDGWSNERPNDGTVVFAARPLPGPGTAVGDEPPADAPGRAAEPDAEPAPPDALPVAAAPAAEPEGPAVGRPDDEPDADEGDEPAEDEEEGLDDTRPLLRGADERAAEAPEPAPGGRGWLAVLAVVGLGLAAAGWWTRDRWWPEQAGAEAAALSSDHVTAAPEAGGGSAAASPRSPAVPAPRPGPADRRSIEDIRWSADGDSLVVVIDVAGDLSPGSFRHFRPPQLPPRAVIRLLGVDDPYPESQLDVGSPLLSAIRFGYHHREGDDEQWVVLDLADARVEVLSVEAGDGALRILLGPGGVVRAAAAASAIR